MLSSTHLRILLLTSLVAATAGANKDDFISVTACYMVDTRTQTDIFQLKDGMVVDTAMIGDELTLRCDTDSDNTESDASWVSFDLDNGGFKRIDNNNDGPFSIGGTSKEGIMYSSKRMSSPGKHTIEVCPSVGGAPSFLPPGLQKRPYKSGKGPAEGGIPTKGQTKKRLLQEDNSIFSSLFNGFFGGSENRRLQKTNQGKGQGQGQGQGQSQGQGNNSGQGNPTSSADSDDVCLRMTYYMMDGVAPVTEPPAPESDVEEYASNPYGIVTGELKKWHKITLGFEGPEASELGASLRLPLDRLSSVFADYRADVTFQHVSSGNEFVVPAFFAMDGNGANSDGEVNSGSVWLCHFVPDMDGMWTWSARFTVGGSVAVTDGVDSASYFDGTTGSFEVAETDKTGADMRATGRLQYTGEHHFQFAGTGEYFFKVGLESPENILAYQDFDGTSDSDVYLKSFDAHEIDFEEGDPTFEGGKGAGLIGAINYLASSGINVLSVTTLTLGGPDGSISPYVNNMNTLMGALAFDVSKLAQWGVILEHAVAKGMVVRIKLQDSGSNDLLDNGNTIFERILYFREMVARFGHLNVIWDLGEEISDVDEIRKRSKILRELDPYNSPIVVQAPEEKQSKVYGSLLGLETIDGVSISSSDMDLIASLTAEWIEKSSFTGHPWVVSNDEQGSLSTGVLVDGSFDMARQDALWGNIMAGGSGVQYYFGASEDLTMEDFNTVRPLLDQTASAKTILSTLPYETMSPASNIVHDVFGAVKVLADTSNRNILVYYQPDSVIAVPSVALVLDLSAGFGRQYLMEWYNPETATVIGSASLISGSPAVPISFPLVGLGGSDLLNRADFILQLVCQAGCD